MTRQQVFRTLLRLLALGAILSVAGCGGGGDRPASVTGHVTFNGKPVTSGTVVFVASDGKSSYPGAVQPDGSYTVSQAPTGSVRVTFDNPPPPKTSAAPGQKDPEAEEAAKDAAHYVPTPPKYKDPNTSGLTCELKKGKNSYDVDLK